MSDSGHIEALTGCGNLREQLAAAQQALSEAQAVAEKLKQEAQVWAGEVDSQKATVFDCYRAAGVTGKADWNGAQPVRTAFESLQAQLSETQAQLKGCAIAAHNYAEAVEYGKTVGYGDEFKKVLTCRQALDASIQREAEAHAKIVALGEQLEHDRSLVADCVTKAREAVSMRDWLTDGRGCYEWNDDNWHKEFAAASSEYLEAIQPMVAVAANWKDCPLKSEDVAKARIDLQSQLSEALKGKAIAERALEKIIRAENARSSERCECDDHSNPDCCGYKDDFYCPQCIAGRAMLAASQLAKEEGR